MMKTILKKINKLVFNKDKLGNYLVTLGKVDSEITEADKKILASYEGAGGLHELNQRVSSVFLIFIKITCQILTA